MGERINSLPKIIRPFASLILNVITRRKETDSEIDVSKKLSFGVEYIYGADVMGDIAEFGTMTGRTASAMTRAMANFEKSHKSLKKIHLFDSFIGLPEAESEIDKQSPHVASGVWGVGTCDGISRESLKKKCSKCLSLDKIIIYDGWFKDTLPEIPKGTKFSLVHIDCDLYQSTIEVLDYLFQNLIIQDGTALFFDDYNCNRASPDFGERKAWEETIEKFGVVFSDCGEYGWAGRKFIVHSYKNK